MSDPGQRYSISDFIERTAERDRGQGLFEFETERLLEVNLNGTVWTKMGSMVAYTGGIKFVREGILEQGIGNLLKKAVSGEGARLTKAEGSGKLYLADQGKKITILNLANESIVVNGQDLLAFEPAIKYEIKMAKKLAAMAAGGLFNIHLNGSGMVAVASHYDPMTLRVTPGNPVYTDPQATVMWSGNLQPSFKTDVSLKTFIGRSSGESYQMHFEGEGWVVIQPFEEGIMGAG
ncbi:MAG: AIM24 family protein [Phycisphaerales bacterium JB063]